MPPILEKVKVHNERAIELGHPKAVGNDLADHHAKVAALGSDVPVAAWDPSPLEDAVLLHDSAGAVIRDVEKGLRAMDWRARESMPRRTRPVLDLMYPRTLEVYWGTSVTIFLRPVVTQAGFVHAAPQWVLKWVARVRAGCLPARARLCRHKMEESAACPCCEAPVEDDEHLLFGCLATGTADWLALLQEAWAASAAELRVEVAMPAMKLLRAHRWQLVAAIFPGSVASEAALPPT